MADKLGWGILGTGNIARKFAEQLPRSNTGRLVAVGSRSRESADKFADEYDAPNRYGSYAELLDDDQVDAVYISLPNDQHAEWTVRCAEAGKHILCEKPFTSHWPELMTVLEAVRRCDVFCMEAFMYRCSNQTARLVELIRQQPIGEVRVIQANFAFNFGTGAGNVRMSTAMSGGGIMDVGCYTMSMVRLIASAALGEELVEPEQITGCGHIDADSGVDTWAVAAVRFPGEIMANLACGMQIGIRSDVSIWGSEGHIIVPAPWFGGNDDKSTIIVHRDGQDEELTVEHDRPLYALEADVLAEHLVDRQAPWPCMTWEDSLGNMKALDQWRRAVGVVFDAETPKGLKRTVTGRMPARRDDHRMTYGRIEGVDKPVSRIVMGSMAIARGDPAFACAMLDHYVELGGNAVDTAHIYGKADATLGQWMKLRGMRNDIIVIAKGAHTPNCTPQGLTDQLLETLDAMQTDRVDIYLMHRDNLDVPVGEFVDCLNEHKAAGRIGAFGGSNWTTQRIDEANAYAASHHLTGFAASSPNFCLAEWNEPMWAGCLAATDSASRQWYGKTQMPLLAWSSQASGLFAGRFGPDDRDDPTLADLERVWFNEANFQRVARAQELAAKKGISANQIALAYVLCQPLNLFALIGPATLDETRTSVAALDIQLTDDEMRWLNLET